MRAAFPYLKPGTEEECVEHGTGESLPIWRFCQLAHRVLHCSPLHIGRAAWRIRKMLYDSLAVGGADEPSCNTAE
jgi:hypothetical protein